MTKEKMLEKYLALRESRKFIVSQSSCSSSCSSCSSCTDGCDCNGGE